METSLRAKQQQQQKTHLLYATNNWRGVWNKALSDFWCNVKFS